MHIISLEKIPKFGFALLLPSIIFKFLSFAPKGGVLLSK